MSQQNPSSEARNKMREIAKKIINSLCCCYDMQKLETLEEALQSLRDEAFAEGQQAAYKDLKYADAAIQKLMNVIRDETIEECAGLASSTGYKDFAEELRERKTPKP